VSFETCQQHTKDDYVSICVRQFDLFDIQSIKQYWKDMENEHKWSWKVL